MSSRNCFFVLTGLLALQAVAATPEDILRTVWKDPRLELHQRALDVATSAQSANPLAKADLRLDRGELNQNDVKIGVRLSPKSYFEYAAGRDYQRAIERNESLARDEVLSRLLASRYDLLARIALLKEKKAMSVEMAKLSRQADRALSFMARKDRSELKSYLKAQSELAKLDIKIADVDREHRLLVTELRALSLQGTEDVDFSDFAGVHELRRKVDLAANPSATKPLTLRMAEKDLEKSVAALAYERAKAGRIFEHVEVSVKDDSGEKVYGVEVAFNLPFASATDPGTADKMVRELRDRAKLIDLSKTSDGTATSAIKELGALLETHKTLLATQSRLDARQLRSAGQAIAGQDPWLAIEMQKSWFEGREQILELEYRIRGLLIMHLHEAGELIRDPGINRLSKTDRRIF